LISVVQVAHGTVSWSQAVDPGFGFIVYYGPFNGGPYGNQIPVNTPSARSTTFTSLPIGTYYFVVTAKNTSDDCESPFSNQVRLDVILP
jgi:hypothetical protein